MDEVRLPDALTEPQLWSSIGRLEHEGLDFSASASKDLQKAMAAMANTDGGRILLGIDDGRRLVGCALTQATLDTVNRAAAAVELDVEVHQLSVDGVHLVEVLVPAAVGRVVTTSDGRILRRRGSDSLPLRGQPLMAFVRDRSDLPGEDDAAGVEWDALDLAAVNAVLRAAGRPAVRRPGVARALRDLHVVPPEATGPNMAALVLFGRPETAAAANWRVQLVHRSGPRPSDGVTRDRRDVSGPLASVAEQCLGWVTERSSEGEVVAGGRRQPVLAFPPDAVREAVLNALAHRDLRLRGATVDVVLWDDALTIRSPGGLPGHVTPDNIRTEHYSRNPRIMRTLKALSLVEEFGEGIDRMFVAMEERVLPAPLVEVTPTSVAVTLVSRSPISLEDQVWLSLLAPLDLGVAERHALALARTRGAIARRDLADARPDVDAGAVLGGLVVKGLLVREGTRGGARYSLSAEVVARAGSGGLQERQRQRERLEAHLRAVGSVSAAEAAEHLQESIDVVRALLRDLVRSGRATRTGRTRATRYHAAAARHP